MATMILKQEVEATPDLVAGELRKFAASMASQKFPFDRGALIKLKAQFLAGVSGLPDMPCVVIASTLGTPLGLIAIYQTTGNITISLINADMVESVWQA